jgi:glycosyltransferase 2 family protein
MKQGIKKRISLAARILASAALLGILFAVTDFRKIAGTLAGARPLWLSIGLLLIGVSVLVSAFKWRLILEAQGLKLGFWDLSGDFASGLFFNNFLPSSIGGDGVRILLVGKRSGRSGEAASSVVIDRLLAGTALGAVGLVASLFARHSVWWISISLAGIAIVSVILVFVAAIGRVPRFLANKEGKAAEFFRGFIVAGEALRGRSGALAASFGVSVLFQLSVAAVIAASMAALGLPLPPAVDIVFVSATASFLAMVPLGINGYGLREAAYVFLLTPYGVPASSAVAVSVLFALSVSAFSLVGAVTWLVNKPSAALRADPAGGN